ncbi:unnamed protein product [Mucor hiemalis]
MSVIVTTSFAQGATYYAGETVSCTITFTNSTQKSNDGSAKNSTLSRANSLSSFDLNSAVINRAQPNGIANNRSRHISSEVESLAMVNAPSRKMSFSSLASSTFSYLTGSTSFTTKDPDSLSEGKNWKMFQESESIIDNEPLERTIDIDGNEDTPRSSIDAQSQYTGSRRSSIDSTVSSIPPPLSRHARSPLNRLSVTSLGRSSSFSSLIHRNFSEHLLWGSAQVVGQFVYDSVLVKSNMFEPLKSKAMYHPFGASAGGGMLTTRSDSLKRESRTIPVFSTPPSILFVDLTLAPGESVKYSYKLKLPHNLPPTYRGKSMRFSYYLVIGSQRSGSNASSTPFGAQGHVVQIPFRVFNHVTESGTRPIYDLLNPEVYYKDQARVDKLEAETIKKEPMYYPSSKKKPVKRTDASEKSRKDFKDYIDDLIEKTASKKSVHKIMQRENDLYDHGEEDQNETRDEASCCQIISRITNTYKKATFDICKGNKRVAQLFLLKTLYRLGEPIQGIVDFEGAVIPTAQVTQIIASIRYLNNI